MNGWPFNVSVLHINSNVTILENVQEMVEGNIIKLVTTLLCLNTLLFNTIEVMNQSSQSPFVSDQS